MILSEYMQYDSMCQKDHFSGWNCFLFSKSFMSLNLILADFVCKNASYFLDKIRKFRVLCTGTTARRYYISLLCPSITSIYFRGFQTAESGPQPFLSPPKILEI